MFCVFQLVVVILALVYSIPAFARMDIVSLKYGSNTIDLDGDGETEQVIRSWRENFNAHGYHIYLFLEESDLDRAQNVSAITVQDPNNGLQQDIVRSSETADCTVSDYILVRTGGDLGVTLLKATRTTTNGYGGTYPVTFEYYKLARNQEGIPGDPYRYWRRYKTITSKQKYCDVHSAVKAEIF